MQISDSLQNITNYFGIQEKNTNKTSPDFQIPSNTHKNFSTPSDNQIIAYYKKMCEEFPEVTFKMSDVETAKTKSAPYYIGYKGNSYQQGDNFSYPDRCSIEIDVDVIRNMMRDAEYEFQVKGTIRNMISDYPRTAQEAQSQGYGYCYAGLSNEDGKLTEYFCYSRTKASTDEEIRDIWKDSFLTGKNTMDQVWFHYNNLVNHTKNKMQETFFSMLDEAQHHKNKFV